MCIYRMRCLCIFKLAAAVTEPFSSSAVFGIRCCVPRVFVCLPLRVGVLRACAWCSRMRGICLRLQPAAERACMCRFARTMQTVDLCSEDSPVLKLYFMTRVPFPKSIELV